MKITAEHVQIMRDAIDPLDTPERRSKYLVGDFTRADRVQDLNKRYRWDLAHSAHLIPFICDELYRYVDDTHIDTALRSIVPELVQS